MEIQADKLDKVIIDIINRINQFKPTSNDWRDLLTKVVESFGFKFLRMDKYDKNLGGVTDGKNIYVFGIWGNSDLYFNIFHELVHALLHFPIPKEGVSKDDLIRMETEADSLAVYLCDLIWPDNYDLWFSHARNNKTRHLLSN